MKRAALRETADGAQLAFQNSNTRIVAIDQRIDPGMGKVKSRLFRASGEFSRCGFVQNAKTRGMGGLPVQARQFFVQRCPVGHADRRVATQSWKACVGLSITAEKTPPANPGAPRPRCMPWVTKRSSESTSFHILAFVARSSA